MCEITHKFTLCSCSTNEKEDIIHNKNSRRYKKTLKQDNSNKMVWTLYKYDGEYDSGMEGILMEPSDKLDESFTANYVKTELNLRQCFDFEYAPQEGDYLVLTKKRDYSYMPFMYKDGQWIIHSYNAFYEKITALKKGKVTFE